MAKKVKVEPPAGVRFVIHRLGTFRWDEPGVETLTQWVEDDEYVAHQMIQFMNTAQHGQTFAFGVNRIFALKVETE